MSTINSTMDSVEQETLEEDGSSRLSSFFKKAKWFFIAFGFLLFFTLVKLPREKLENLIDAHLKNAAYSAGIDFSSQEADLSIGFGLSYELKKVILTVMKTGKSVQIDQITISPSYLSLFTGKLGADVNLEHGGGVVDVVAAVGSESFALKADVSDLSLEKLGVLRAFAKVKGDVQVDGLVELDGNPRNLKSMNGIVDLKLSNLSLNAQSIQGFKIPRIRVQGGEGKIRVENGKVKLQKLLLGKSANKKDDLFLIGKGDITLGRVPAMSLLNIDFEFGFSEKVQSSLSLLESLLSSGRQKSGSYKFNFSGPMSGPTVSPIRESK